MGNRQPLNLKVKGDIAELEFAILCMELGYIVSKPLTQISKYDFVLDVNGRLFKIQVKSTSSKFPANGKSYAYNAVTCSGRSVKRFYSNKQVDYVAIHVVPLDTWYLIPIDEIKTKTIKLYPHRENCDMKYEKYKLNATNREEHSD